MRFCLAVILVLSGSFSWGATTHSTPQKTPNPEGITAKQAASGKAEKTPEPEKKPRWIPAPAPVPENRALKYRILAVTRDDKDGLSVFSVLDTTARRTLDEYSVVADGTVRFMKATSSSDNVDSLQIREAKLSYIENWLQLSAGRMDIGDMMSPTAYFGCYPTMGIRRVDAGAIILPIRFAFGVVDYKGVTAPPTAISFFYMPSILSAYTADPDGRQAFFLGQVRFKTNISGVQTTLRFNAGGSKSEYFTYSTINGNRTLSGTADFNIAKNYTFYAEYGIQNNRRANDTAAFCYGAKAERIGTWGPFSIDSVLFEMQMPMTKGTSNPFAGGNGIFPALGSKPETSWYGRIRARAKAIFVDFNITNAVGDYSFNRLTPAVLNTELPLPMGPGNETDGTRLPFTAKDYDTKAYLVSAGVEF